MTYRNRVIERVAPATRCQCAVLAVLGEEWVTPSEVWNRRPTYLASAKHGRVQPVGYGTINAILLGLVEQGLAERRGSGKVKQYRSVVGSRGPTNNLPEKHGREDLDDA